MRNRLPGRTVRHGLLVAIALSAGGCVDGSESVATAPGTGSVDAERRSALRTLGDADTFFEELRGALVSSRTGGYGSEEELSAGEAFDGESAGVPTSADADIGGNGSGGNGSGGGTDGDDVAADVTATNVQERGVDEQDRVKVSRDGAYLYVLHEDHGDVVHPGGVLVEDVDSGETIEIEPGGASIDPIGGLPSQGPRTTLRILALDAASTEATSLRDIELDLDGRGAQGMYLHESASGRALLISSSGGGHWSHWAEPAAFGGQESLLTRVDVSDPDAVAIDASLHLDGQIVSSRRIGKHLFLASRYYPAIPGLSPYELSAEAWRAAVEGTDEAALLPHYTTNGGEPAIPLIDPARCFVAPRVDESEWYTPDIVTLAVIDLDAMTLADSECYLGASETLYASPDAVYLATTRWDHDDATVIDDPDEPSVGGSRVETDIHQFDIDGGTLTYRGSGSVRGHLGWNALRKPFRMSAREGFLRVATIDDAFGTERISPIRLSVLEPGDDGELVRVAELPNENEPTPIGKPGEQLYASRFVGERAYLVTFLQTDPLYVIDLSEPRAPRVLGELEIEGYSDYLLPIGERHLLGIGRDAIAAPGAGEDGERGGLVQGIKLSLFDVTDPTRPSEIDSLLVGERGTQSQALFDHRGITVQTANDSHPTRVSFGIDVAGVPLPTSRPTPAEAIGYRPWTHTGLYGFDIHGGDAADIEYRGALVVERASDVGHRFPGFADDRAVMVDEATYYVHGSRVYVAPWDDLGNPSGSR